MSGMLGEWMAAISEDLLSAVIGILVLLSGYILLLLGGFLRESASRKRERDAIETGVRLASKTSSPDVSSVTSALSRGSTGLAAHLVRTQEELGLDEADRVLLSLNHQVRKSLATHTLLTRIAPMGGLIATLLPLGPALQGLGRGDISEFADQLTVAFAATVVGLVVSCLAFGMGVVRRSWYQRDLQDLEGILLRLAPTERSTPRPETRS